MNTQDWTVTQDADGWRAELGETVARGDTRERAMQSLFEKLELLKQRCISTARLGSPKPPAQRRDGDSVVANGGKGIVLQ